MTHSHREHACPGHRWVKASLCTSFQELRLHEWCQLCGDQRKAGADPHRSTKETRASAPHEPFSSEGQRGWGNRRVGNAITTQQRKQCRSTQHPHQADGPGCHADCPSLALELAELWGSLPSAACPAGGGQASLYPPALPLRLVITESPFISHFLK